MGRPTLSCEAVAQGRLAHEHGEGGKESWQGGEGIWELSSWAASGNNPPGSDKPHHTSVCQRMWLPTNA